MSDHTPGPWKAEIVGANWFINSMHAVIAKIYGNTFDQGPPGNGRLLAAAPEMLEALRDVLTGKKKQTIDFGDPIDYSKRLDRCPGCGTGNARHYSDCTWEKARKLLARIDKGDA